MNTDRAWEKWGSQEPYYAVLTKDAYKSKNIDDSGRRSFFSSGVDQIRRVVEDYTRLRGDAARFGSALDFGCGVGRLTIPLSNYFALVTGVDVSQSMLDEAERNCELSSVKNVNLVRVSEFMNGKHSQFDLITSFLVFQHIRPRRGETLLAELLCRLAPGGMAVIQMTYADRFGEDVLAWLRNRAHFLRRAWWVLRNKQWVAPMEMHPYNISRVFSVFDNQGLSTLEASLGRMDNLRTITVVGIKRNSA